VRSRDLEMTAKGYSDVEPYMRPMLGCLHCLGKFPIGNGRTIETESPFCYKTACRNSFTYHVWDVKRRSKV
jgi:hypothetical protein